MQTLKFLIFLQIGNLFEYFDHYEFKKETEASYFPITSYTNPIWYIFFFPFIIKLRHSPN